MVLNSSITGLKLENTNLLNSSSPVEFFKLFITGDFVTKMAEQTNFYAVERGPPWSFMPVNDGVINLYLYINNHTDSGRRPETIFVCSLSKTHPLAMNSFVLLNSMQKFITWFKKKIKNRHIVRWIHCSFDKCLTLQIFGVINNKCSCHHISLKRATILLFLFNLAKKFWFF